MKIIRDDKVYIQKNDIAYLNMSDVAIPEFVYYVMYGQGPVIVGDFNRSDFVEYSGKTIVDFLKKLTWILDYDEVKDLSISEMDLLGEELIDQRNSIASMYNSMSEEEREKNESLRSQCELLEYKAKSLREFQLYRSGKNNMQLPKGVDSTVKSKKGIKQFVKSLFSEYKK